MEFGIEKPTLESIFPLLMDSSTVHEIPLSFLTFFDVKFHRVDSPAFTLENGDRLTCRDKTFESFRGVVELLSDTDYNHYVLCLTQWWSILPDGSDIEPRFCLRHARQLKSKS